MTATTMESRVPEALPVEVEPPRIVTVPAREADGDDEGGLKIKPLAYLRYRWATVVFLGAAVAGALAFTAYSLIPAKYTTYSIIRVSPSDPRIYYNEDQHGRNDFNSYLNTQASVLRQNFVLTAALRNPEIAALAMLKAQDDPVRFLEEELIIEKSEGSELIKPKLSGDDPKAITMIVNAVHEAYFTEVVEAERKRKQERLKQLEDTMQKMKTELETKTPLAPKTGEQPAESLPGIGPTVAAAQVARLREKLDQAEIRQKQLEESRTRLQRRKDNIEGELPPVPAGFVAQLEADPAIVQINRQVANWERTLNYQLELNPAADNQGIRDLKKRIAEAATERERVRKERMVEFQKSQVDQFARALHDEEERIDSELAGLRILQQKTRDEMKEYEAKLAKILPDGEEKKDFTKVDTKNREQIITGLMDKATLLKVELSAPSRVQSLQKAAVPMKRETKKQLLGTAAAGLIGFGIVGFGVIAFEARARRVMAITDVQKATLSPILGAIPAIKGTAEEPTADMALAEEAIEKARANLMQQFGRPGGKVILVASAIGDEGRTFLARELALSFARAGGQTLLVDFDLRTPTLHEPFEVPNEVGFCDFLAGTADLPSATRILPYGIALMPAGVWSDITRQYLSGPRIAEALAELRERFDYVIVNAHPILAVAETALAARAADGIVLTAEKYESRLPLVSRAQEKIATLAPEAFGVVVVNASHDECLQ